MDADEQDIPPLPGRQELRNRRKPASIAQDARNYHAAGPPLHRTKSASPLHAIKFAVTTAKLFPMLIFEQRNGEITQTFAKITRDDLLQLLRHSPPTASAASKAAHIAARDLHALDPTVNLHGPSFFIRRNAILVNLHPFKAVITANKMYVFLSARSTNGDKILERLLPREEEEVALLRASELTTELNLGQEVPEGYGPVLLSQDLFDIFTRIVEEYDNSSFEVNALECLLCAFSDYINSEYLELFPLVAEIGDELLLKRTSGTILTRLRQIRNVVDNQHGDVTDAISALDEVLKDDSTMAEMNFTSANADDFELIELLFDTYLQAMETTLGKLLDLRNDIETLNDVKMLHLDQTRNILLRVELIFSIITSLAGVGALVAGIFGMNLNSTVEDEAHWFWIIAALLLGMLFFCTLGLTAWFYHKGLFT